METIKNKKVGIYVRSSTDSRESIKRQVIVCEQIAETNGFRTKPYCVFQDCGKSGASDDRPGLIGLLDAVRDGQIHAVIAEDCTVLTRSVALLTKFHHFLELCGATILTGEDPKLIQEGLQR